MSHIMLLFAINLLISFALEIQTAITDDLKGFLNLFEKCERIEMCVVATWLVFFSVFFCNA